MFPKLVMSEIISLGFGALTFVILLLILVAAGTQAPGAGLSSGLHFPGDEQLTGILAKPLKTVVLGLASHQVPLAWRNPDHHSAHG